MRWTPEKIKQRRDELGETQEEFGRRIGQSVRTITDWETGKSRPRKTIELDKLGPPKPMPEPARERSPLEGVDLAAAKVADLVAHMLDVATELNRRVPSSGERGFITTEGPTGPDGLDGPFGVEGNRDVHKRLEG